MENVDISVLIVNWNTKDLLQESLESIFKYTEGITFEVVVFDNGSEDGSREMVKEKFPEVVLIESSTNEGFVVGNLEGYKKSKGEYVLMLNSDAYLGSNSLKQMVDVMKSDDSIGILGPKLKYPDGSLQKSVRRFPDFASQWRILLKLHNLFPNGKAVSRYYMNDFDYNTSGEVDQVMGAALLTRRDIIEKHGFLDDTFWAWFEEVDFCKRVKDAGYKVYYYADAFVHHHKGQSFKNLAKRQKLFNTSMGYYFGKHHTKSQAMRLKMLMPLSLLLSHLIQITGKLVPLKKNRDL